VTEPIDYGAAGRPGYPNFHRQLDKAGLPQRRFHDLRHSCATLLLMQGVSPRVVVDVLDHSQIALTMNTYSHVIPELKRDAADRIEELLNG
jgi:integrase